MVRMRQRCAFPAVFAALVAACHGPEASPGVDPDMARFVTSDTIAVAGVRLDRIRTGTLPGGWSAALEPFREANEALLAYNGREFLVIAHGHFSAPLAGAVLLANGIALAGPPEWVRAATLQRATGHTGVSALLEKARPFAAKPVWIVVRGGVRLPFPGNLANLNKLLQLTDYIAIGADLEPNMKLRGIASCLSPDAAQHLEETIRAMLTLARAANPDQDLAAILESAEVQRTGLTVEISVSGNATALDKLLR